MFPSAQNTFFFQVWEHFWHDIQSCQAESIAWCRHQNTPESLGKMLSWGMAQALSLLFQILVSGIAICFGTIYFRKICKCLKYGEVKDRLMNIPKKVLINCKANIYNPLLEFHKAWMYVSHSYVLEDQCSSVILCQACSALLEEKWQCGWLHNHIEMLSVVSHPSG